MKNIIKILAALTLLCINLKADVLTGSFTTNETRLVWTNAVVIHSLQISATSGGPFILQLFDDNLAVTTYTNAAYTNVTSYTTNLVTTFVGATGVTNSYTNTVLFTDRLAVAASTNNIAAIGSWAIGVNESLLIPGPFIIAKGVVLKNISNAVSTNAVGGTYVVNYRSP